MASFLSGVLVIGIFLVLPVYSVIFEIKMLFVALIKCSKKPEYGEWYENRKRLKKSYERHIKIGYITESVLIFLALFMEDIYLDLIKEVIFKSDWSTQLYNFQLHTPFNMNYVAGPIAILAVFLVSMIVLYVCKADKLPPIFLALSMSGLYIGVIYCFIWTVHILKNPELTDGVLLILPVNLLLISLRLIITKSTEYEIENNRSSAIEGNKVLGPLSSFRQKAAYLPLLGLLLVIPLLGIIAVILVLFGQAPDAAIKAFTETADFGLSKHVGPPNLTMDEHYLCTVAAEGDEWLVRPLRSGVRHGHEVTVNRQLLIANAFEDVLIERTPGFHRRIRHFYDTYGFPIAKLIKKKWVADMVYLLMKPLEWIFLLVLYMVDVHPEDRIAMQYTGKTVKQLLM